MKKRKTQIISVTVLVILFLLYFRIYKIDSFEITVVDADTNQPLSDVILLAYWQLHMGSPAGTVQTGILDVVESQSGANGKVGYPGRWKIVPWHRGWISESYNPAIVVYRRGYLDRELNNVEKVRSINGDRIYRKLRTQADNGIKDPIYAGNFSFWRGRQVGLEKGKTNVVLDWSITALSTTLSKIKSNYTTECIWNKVPLSLMAKEKIISRFYQENNKTLIERIKTDLDKSTGCPSIDEIAERYL